MWLNLARMTLIYTPIISFGNHDMILLGEAHNSAASVSLVEAIIRKTKPTVLIHELLFDYMGGYVKLNSGNFSNVPQYAVGTNDDLFDLVVELKIPIVIGCDLPEKALDLIRNKSLEEQFIAREKRMFEIIREYSGRKDVVVVLGDIHLRETTSKDFPDLPPLVQAIQSGKIKAKVTRVPDSLQEHK